MTPLDAAIQKANALLSEVPVGSEEHKLGSELVRWLEHYKDLTTKDEACLQAACEVLDRRISPLELMSTRTPTEDNMMNRLIKVRRNIQEVATLWAQPAVRP